MIVLYHCLSSTEKSKKITRRFNDKINLLKLLSHIFNISITMKNIFSSSKQNISSLLLWDTPPNEIASITDVRRSNTYEYKRTLKLYSKNLQGGQLSELSPADQRRTLGEIIEVRVDNAAHAVQFINYIIYIPHCPYMSGNLTKNMA